MTDDHSPRGSRSRLLRWLGIAGDEDEHGEEPPGDLSGFRDPSAREIWLPAKRRLLGKVADWFEQELDEKIKRLTAVIEPLLIIFVGGIVALVASAIFLPIVGAIQAML